MSYAILGYLMIALIVVLLLTNKATPITAFVIIPPIVALVAGYSIEEVNGFIQAGVSSSMGTALLALLSIIFFSIMTEQGLFDPFVNFLVSKAGNNVAVITVISAIVAHFSHLDTGTTSTLLVTIPSMLPIYRRLGIDRKYLYLVIVQAIGVMNLLPWGGAITRSCAVTVWIRPPSRWLWRPVWWLDLPITWSPPGFTASGPRRKSPLAFWIPARARTAAMWAWWWRRR